METKSYIFQILPRLINFRLARIGVAKAMRPMVLTFSVTGACQSLCKTCHIGSHFKGNPEQIKKLNLTIEEIRKFFENLGFAYFFNVSGGEPYLRDDLAEIIELAMRYLKPEIVHIPTNAFLPEKIERVTRMVLNIINRYNPQTSFTVKPSLDGIGERHDEIRGLRGNFERLVETVQRLKSLEKEYSQFHLELGTVISKYNISDLEEIQDWVYGSGIQSYRNEIAEQREELLNMNEDITPTVEMYERLMVRFKKEAKENLRSKDPFVKVLESMRLVYYDLAVRVLREQRQIIPCFAGVSNVHLNYDAEIWPCCVLGHAHSMGNIRDWDYNYDRLVSSQQAKRARMFIRKKNCFCPLANQSYSNMILSVPYLFRMFTTYLKYK